MERHYITKVGMEKLVTELAEWRSVKRPLVVKRLEMARSHGDLSENAEYHAAREELARIDQKIFQLEGMIRTATLIDESTIATDQVRPYTKVRIFDPEKNAERVYSLVSETEANAAEGRISHRSPVAKGLLGAKVGETVEIQIPAGTVSWKILEILPIQS